jgi:hypothetical protein
MELKGPVGEAMVAPRARDQALAAKLWAVSEKLTGVHWAVGPLAFGAATPVMTEQSLA